jgi:hypothetical protein
MFSMGSVVMDNILVLVSSVVVVADVDAFNNAYAATRLALLLALLLLIDDDDDDNDDDADQ